MTLRKLLDTEADMPRTAGRQIHRGNASASTPFDYHLRNMSSISWPFDKTIKYGSMIPKMHAFVPLMIEMRKVEEVIRLRKLSMNTDMVYSLPEMLSKNTQGGHGKLFERKINPILWQKIKNLRQGFLFKYLCLVNNLRTVVYSLIPKFFRLS